MRSLMLLFMTIFLLFTGCEQQNGAIKLNPKAYLEKISAEKEAQIIDVRTPEEFMEEHIESAKNINFYDPEFKAMIQLLDKSKPIYIYCRSGSRSGQSISHFTAEGFNQIFDLEGGILNWKKENLKTIK